MASKRRRLPVNPEAILFEHHSHLVNLASRLADLAWFGARADYAAEVAEANRHLTKAEAGFIAGFIAAMNLPEVP